ncbi:MAG: hypothetical protein ABIA12_01150 [Candidatus Aenigmatarchaeota archaeon]
MSIKRDKWDYDRELGKRMGEAPDEIIWHINKKYQRVETDREYKQRIGERNIGLMNGVLLGLLLGLAISLILDAIPRLFSITSNPVVELILATALIVVFSKFFELITKQEFEFTSERGFQILLIIIAIMTIAVLFGYYFAIHIGVIII